MRKLLLSLVLGVFSLGMVALTPSTAAARNWRGGWGGAPGYYRSYYPGYSYYYTNPSYSYYYANPGYSSFYSGPSYYNAWSMPGYTSYPYTAFPQPGYYTSNWYTPGYTSFYWSY